MSMDDDQSARNHARRRSASVALLGGDTRTGGVSFASSALNPPHIPDADHDTDRRPANAASGSDSRDSSSHWEMDDFSDEHLEDDEETGLTDSKRDRRQGRKRRNTLLDERIAQESTLKKTQDRMASRTFTREALINGLLIALWYCFSISISVFNKWILSKDEVDFHFPLFFTSCHMIIQFLLAGSVLYMIPRFRPSAPEFPSEQQSYTEVPQSQQDNAAQPSKKPTMTLWFYLTRIAPCGAATGLDIGLGNMSMMYITLTFFTMCKSSVLGFVLFFAFLFRLEKPSWKLAAVIITMAIGVVMMVAGETAFNALGFILIMSAAFFSGFRWSLTQILLLRNPSTSNPFSSIFFLAPIMFVTLIIIAIPLEGPLEFIAGWQRLSEAKGGALATAILLFPGLLAFLMTAAEFALLKRTSVVTLSVCGIFKEVLTISASAYRFGDELTPINISGLLVTILSIAAYNYMKVQRMRDVARREAQEHVRAESPPLLNAAERRKSVGVGDLEDDSTTGLIRNSLSVPVDGMDRVRKGIGVEAERASPVKRPENLE